MPVPLTTAPFWAPLRDELGAAWRGWRRGGDSVRALAALDDDDACHLSEVGQRLRKAARRDGHARLPERPVTAPGLRPQTPLIATIFLLALNDCQGGDITEVTLAQGPGAFGMTQISEIVKKPGADYVGPFPAELQNYTDVTAGIPAGAEPSEAVRALIGFLRSPTAAAALKQRGMEVE